VKESKPFWRKENQYILDIQMVFLLYGYRKIGVEKSLAEMSYESAER
jgi:hypothetical protein